MTTKDTAYTTFHVLPPLTFPVGAELACREPDVDPEWFFSYHGGNGDPYVKARPVCERCPVRRRCADWAREVSQVTALAGFWGGTTPEERRARGGKPTGETW